MNECLVARFQRLLRCNITPFYIAILRCQQKCCAAPIFVFAGRFPSIQTRKQDIGEAELREIAHPHGVERALQMVAFVLHDAGMEAADRAVDRLAVLAAPLVADAPVSRHQPAQAGHRETAFPAVFGFIVERRDPRIDQYRLRNGLGIRVTGAVLEAEYHQAGSRISIPELQPDGWSVVKASPAAIMNTIVRPLIWEARNPMMLASAVENDFVVIFVLFCLVYTDWKKTQGLNLFLFLLCGALTYFALIGMATPVLGNLVRYKTPLLPLFLLAFIFRVKPVMVADNFGFVLRR